MTGKPSYLIKREQVFARQDSAIYIYIYIYILRKFQIIIIKHYGKIQININRHVELFILYIILFF